ncbi:MAG: hypothetical protein IRY83_13265 [Chloroflexi bacterium]|nr:hypothetical protein [Chloroflexota bacterium]
MNLTREYAKAFDVKRRMLGPAGPLRLLRARGGAEFETLLELASGWDVTALNIAMFDDAVPRREIRIAAREDPTAETQLVAALEAATDLAIDGRVYKLEKERTEEPFREPRLHILRGYYTDVRLS